MNACGSFTLVPSDILNFTSNVYANSGSTITNGACVYVRISGNPSAAADERYDIRPNGKSIIQNGSSAIEGMRLNITTNTLGDCTTSFQKEVYFNSASYGQLKITGFTTSLNDVMNMKGNTCKSNIQDINFSFSNSTYGVMKSWATGFTTNSFSTDIENYYANNVSYLIYVNNTGTGGILNPPIGMSLYPCNINLNSTLYSVSGNLTTFSTIKYYGSNCYEYFAEPIILMNLTGNQFGGTTTNGTQVFNSNKLFYANGNITTRIQNGTNGETYGHNGTGNFTYTNTSANLWLNFQDYFYNPNQQIKTKINLANLTLTGKFYYCVGGYCNPLYLSNYSAFPFYINVPDTLNVMSLDNSYSEVKFWWKQGGAYYLVASSINNQDTYFFLQPNGVYNLEINNGTNATNTSITNNCPNIYSVCTIQVLGNGSYSITPIANYAALWADVSYSISPIGEYWFKNNTNISFTISSVNSSLQYFGMTIVKYFNNTRTTIYNTTSNTTAGGTLNTTTNGSGRYVITTWFKHQDFQVYYPLKKTVYVANATGLASISETLSAGTLIDGWTYTLIALIITALIVGFLGRYTIDGAGFVGIAVFTIFALLYPGAEVISGISIMVLDIIMAVMVIALFALKQYV